MKKYHHFNSSKLQNQTNYIYEFDHNVVVVVHNKYFLNRHWFYVKRKKT
jgi:hypothetical protein